VEGAYIAETEFGGSATEFPLARVGAEDWQIKLEIATGEILSYLIDTNVVSQVIKGIPDLPVQTWLTTMAQDELYLSVISIEEIRQGIELINEGKRKQSLDTWLTQKILKAYSDRILAITATIADRCGRLLAAEQKKGRNPNVRDVYIAATAQVHGLTLATLNRRHFEGLGVAMVKF